MALRKCPKCEVNYLLGDETLCSVCSGKSKAGVYVDEESDAVICANCGENEALRGEEYCALCYAELHKSPDARPKAPPVPDDDAKAPEEVLKSIDEVDIDEPVFELPEIQPEIDVDDVDDLDEDDEEHIYLDSLPQEDDVDDDDEDDYDL